MGGLTGVGVVASAVASAVFAMWYGKGRQISHLFIAAGLAIVAAALGLTATQ
jgi:hypothetical protein